MFAAGDVTNIKYKQVVISAGEGAKAALGRKVSAGKRIGEAGGKYGLGFGHEQKRGLLVGSLGAEGEALH